MDNSGAFLAPWAPYGAHNLTAEQCSSEGEFSDWWALAKTVEYFAEDAYFYLIIKLSCPHVFCSIQICLTIPSKELHEMYSWIG